MFRAARVYSKGKTVTKYVTVSVRQLPVFQFIMESIIGVNLLIMGIVFSNSEMLITLLDICHKKLATRYCISCVINVVYIGKIRDKMSYGKYPVTL